MKKTLIAIAATTVAMATFASSSAEAGFHFGGHHHGLIGAILHGGLHHCHHWHPEYVVRTPVEPVYVTRRAQTVSVPDQEPEVPASVAHNENSSIAVGAPTEVSSNEEPGSVENIIVKKNSTAEKKVEPAKLADASIEPVSTTAKRLDCKQFFPSVGMTLSVPCE
jgi:hypothetical protein